jgi:hypothetical protein
VEPSTWVAAASPLPSKVAADNGGGILDSDGRASGSSFDSGGVGHDRGLDWDMGGRTLALVRLGHHFMGPSAPSKVLPPGRFHNPTDQLDTLLLVDDEDDRSDHFDSPG